MISSRPNTDYCFMFQVSALYTTAVSSELVIVTGEVTPSQAVNNEKLKAWVLCTIDGVIETAGCTCKAGQGKSCSHAGAILWKVCQKCN